MNTSERNLSDAFHGLADRVQGSVDFDAVARRVAHRRRQVRALMAAGVTTVVAGLAIGLTQAVPGGATRVVTPTGPPTTEKATTTTTTKAPPSQPSGLRPGPYGFLIPSGARTTLPLTSFGGPAKWAKFADPANHTLLAYEFSGGETGQAYLDNHDPNPAGVLGAPSSGPISYLASCTVTSHTSVASNILTYTCATTTPGTVTGGVIVVEPFAQGYKVLQVTLPGSQSAQLRAILKSLYSG